MISLMVRYRIKEGKVVEAKKAVKEFVNEVRKRERETLFYQTFQIHGKEREFIHFMKCQEPPVTDWWHVSATLRVVLEHLRIPRVIQTTRL